MTLIDFQRCKIRQIESSLLSKHLMPYLRNNFSQEIMDYAAQCLLPNEKCGNAVIPAMFFEYFFPAFVLFQWTTNETFGLDHAMFLEPIAIQHAKVNTASLTKNQKGFIESVCHTHYSFYQVLKVEPGQSLLVKDILLGSLHHVREDRGTRFFQQGDIIFSLLFTSNEESIFVGAAPIRIPSRYYATCLYIRDIIRQETQVKKVTSALLYSNYSPFILNNFIDLMLEIYNTPPTEDRYGDPYQTCHLHYKSTTSMEETLTQLLPLILFDNVDLLIEELKSEEESKTNLEFSCVEYDLETNECCGVIGYMAMNSTNFIVTGMTEQATHKIQTYIENFCTEDVIFKEIVRDPIRSYIHDPEERVELDGSLTNF